MRIKDCVAMILAGGQGTRLASLTKKLAKPAVPFGGKYRIIDFPLSNCRNSDIDTIGVLTQYQPLALHSYIGIGSAWDLDRRHAGGVYVLPPYSQEKGAEWYKGTADAIYQNLNFISLFEPEHVLVLSGDHIYKMDYAKMIQYHTSKNADATIAVIEVPWDEASRFGIMNTGKNDVIKEFDEKPKNPKNNLASMGIYVFNWRILKKYLEEDAKADSSHDFGKDIIPKMLNDGLKLYAHRFEGYWKDVGTVESYWQASMDLVGDVPEFDIYDPSWRIYSVNPTQPPQYIAETAKVKCSIVSEGCRIFGEVENSVIFPGVYIGPGAVIKDSIVMPYVAIGSDSVIQKSIIGRKTVIENGSRIGGTESQNVGTNTWFSGITLIGDNLIINSSTKIRRNVLL